ncbi:hypothetical protein LAZ67_20002690 [Cordylochernes scorpioides]|uniref:Uncharacterized protein n=1 Tax=Cordylochernes scorpioides TaxID=51811 RepID=A0ABY6LKX1_9ARAC|nr:hypothetical protein LAZ67_20002690 [Cordylochernes scorpioides]
MSAVLRSTIFLMGPMRQLRRMFSSNRWLATLLYLGDLLLLSYLHSIISGGVCRGKSRAHQWMSFLLLLLSYLHSIILGYQTCRAC